MKILELTQFFGEAHPTVPIFIAAEDISCIKPISSNKRTAIYLKGNQFEIKVCEEVNHVLKKWKESF